MEYALVISSELSSAVKRKSVCFEVALSAVNFALGLFYGLTKRGVCLRRVVNSLSHTILNRVLLC